MSGHAVNQAEVNRFGAAALIAGILAIAAFAATLGISRQEWTDGLRSAAQASGTTARASMVGGRWSGRMAQKLGGASWMIFRRFKMPSFGSGEEHAGHVSEDAADGLGDGRREPTLGKRRKVSGDGQDPSKPPKKKIVAARRKKPAVGKRAAESDQQSLDLGTGEYSLPPLEALDEPPEDNGENKQDEEALAENARLLESVLEDFGVRGRIVKVRPGPVVTLYELEPAPGTKSSRVISLADDIARSMSAVSVRVAVVPGKNVIGIELPNTQRDLVALLDNNVAFPTALWRWCAAQDTRLIYASSAATYGDGANGFDDDPDPPALAALEPLNGYGQSKQLFDIDAALMARMGCRPPQWAGLKFFNVYGPNEYHKDGQRSVAVQLFEQISASGRAKLFRSHHADYEDGG